MPEENIQGGPKKVPYFVFHPKVVFYNFFSILFRWCRQQAWEIILTSIWIQLDAILQSSEWKSLRRTLPQNQFAAKFWGTGTAANVGSIRYTVPAKISPALPLCQKNWHCGKVRLDDSYRLLHSKLSSWIHIGIDRISQACCLNHLKKYAKEL